MVNPQFVSKIGAYSWEWKKNEQFFIRTKTNPSPNHTFDLVFMSGYLAFDFGSSDTDWVSDSLVFAFKDIKWVNKPAVKVVPVVSLGSISNIQTDDTETIGWGIDSTHVDLIPDTPGSSSVIIQLTSSIAVRGVDTHLSRATYYVAAMGLIRD
jgi:hypothetical protein